LREIEEMMMARGVLVTHETIHQRCRKFQSDLREPVASPRPRPGDRRVGSWRYDYH
jgi:putative transposase